MALDERFARIELGRVCDWRARFTVIRPAFEDGAEILFNTIEHFFD
jgi:hypothetical protein